MRQSSRQQHAVERLKSIDAGSDFFFDEETGAPKFIKGRLSKPSDDEPETVARAFLKDNAGLVDVQEDLLEALEVSNIEKDNQGFSHVYFAQSLNGVPVFEGSTQVHINSAGEVIAYKDYRLMELDASLEPRIAEQDAMATVLRDIGEKQESITESNTRLMLFRDSEKKTHLVWEIEWIRKDELAASLHIIDAHSGSILLKHTRMRGVASRMTYSAERTTNLKATLMAQDDQPSTDHVAQAAHEHAATVYDYFYKSFGRDSYDGRGADLVSTVHYKQNYNNAYWTDWYKQMVYGDGDGNLFGPLALALDVVGHELTHAVTSRTARFVYAEEAGALDESFADFFGIMVSNDGEIVDWKIGEGVYTPFQSGDALRDLSDPVRYNQPDHMNDFMALEPGEQPDSNKNDNGYVHSNSGVPNKAAYLTVAGGTHHGIVVEGTGREKAEHIYYLAMTSYLSSATDSRWTFKQARYALLNACRQLYGDNGSEYAAVKSAWAAIGVGEPDTKFSIIHKHISPNLAIPDDEASGVESVLQIEEEGLLKDIYIGIDIEHTYIGDLRVVLTSPAGESVVLHDRSGGSARDIVETYSLDSHVRLNTFVGDDVHGNWRLLVSDHAGVDTGKLLFWEFELSIQKADKKTIEKEVFPDQQIPDNDPGGVENLIEIQESGRLERLDVPVEISHTYIGDLRVVLVSPSGTEILLHNRSGNSRNDINKIFSTTTDDPMLLLVDEAVQGVWKLRVVDEYARDVGTLRKWGLNITYV